MLTSILWPRLASWKHAESIPGEFIQHLQLSYDTLHPDPSKVSLEAAIEWWKITTVTPENASPKPSLERFDEICEETKSHDKILKFLGM